MIIDETFERRVLACILRNNDFCSIAAQHLRPTYFEGAVRNNLGKMGLEFFSKFDTHLTNAGFAFLLQKLVDTKFVPESDKRLYADEYFALGKLDITDWRFVLDELVKFIKHNEYKQLVERMATGWLAKGEFDRIEKEFARLNNISAVVQPSDYDHFDMVRLKERTDARIEESLVKRLGIPTGIKAMDDTLHKQGWFGKELYVLMAGPKRGKTMALLYFSNFATANDFNVAHFTCEVSKDVCSTRLDAMNADIELRYLRNKAKDAYARLKERRAGGKLLIYEYPTKTLTVPMIEHQVRMYEDRTGTPIHMISVDYGDILKPRVSYADRWQEEAHIFEDLRGLAGKLNVPVLTATQVNRSGAGKMLVRGADTKGSYEKVMIADEIITFSATDHELKDNLLRIHFSESRNSPQRTFVIKTSYNFGKFYKEYVTAE